jgi:hypothetical protein
LGNLGWCDRRFWKRIASVEHIGSSYSPELFKELCHIESSALIFLVQSLQSMLKWKIIEGKAMGKPQVVEKSIPRPKSTTPKSPFQKNSPEVLFLEILLAKLSKNISVLFTEVNTAFSAWVLQ